MGINVKNFKITLFKNALKKDKELSKKSTFLEIKYFLYSLSFLSAFLKIMIIFLLYIHFQICIEEIGSKIAIFS